MINIFIKIYFLIITLKWICWPFLFWSRKEAWNKWNIDQKIKAAYRSVEILVLREPKMIIPHMSISACSLFTITLTCVSPSQTSRVHLSQLQRVHNGPVCSHNQVCSWNMVAVGSEPESSWSKLRIRKARASVGKTYLWGNRRYK